MSFLSIDESSIEISEGIEVDIPIFPEKLGCVPTYATSNSSGFDMYAHIEEPMVIAPGKIAVVPTGCYMAILEGFEIQIRPRSGLAIKGITVLNAPGTIDADYRGEIKIILINHGESDFVIEPMMRIAQGVLAPVFRAKFHVVGNKDQLSPTKRGTGGFGHTGLK
jgi:dUTP pyrophosphatase